MTFNKFCRFLTKLFYSLSIFGDFMENFATIKEILQNFRKLWSIFKKSSDFLENSPFMQKILAAFKRNLVIFDKVYDIKNFRILSYSLKSFVYVSLLSIYDIRGFFVYRVAMSDRNCQ